MGQKNKVNFIIRGDKSAMERHRFSFAGTKTAKQLYLHKSFSNCRQVFWFKTWPENLDSFWSETHGKRTADDIECKQIGEEERKINWKTALIVILMRIENHPKTVLYE